MVRWATRSRSGPADLHRRKRPRYQDGAATRPFAARRALPGSSASRTLEVHDLHSRIAPRWDRRFDVSGIRKALEATADPASEKDILIRATLFDLLIGNTDGHAKNFALLFERGGRVRMAPRYDILPTRLDDGLTDELAYRIGDATTLPEISIESFEAFLGIMGIDTSAARRRIRQRYATEVASALTSHLDDLNKRGMKRFAELIASNIRIFLDAL